VRELGSNQLFDYRLSLAILPDAPVDDFFDLEGGTLVNGTSVDGSITGGDIDIFTFSAAAGDNIVLSAVDLGFSNSDDVRLDIYGPDGGLVGSESANTGLDLDLVASFGGTFYAVVRELGSNNFFPYRLNLQVFPDTPPLDPVDADDGELVDGQTRNGYLTFGDLDLFTFDASFGDDFVITARDLSGSNSVDVRVDVYDPDGELLGTNFSNTQASVSVNNATATGEYVAIVRELGSNNTGLYTVGYNATPGLDTTAPTVAGTQFNFETGQEVDFYFSEPVDGLTFRDFTVENLDTGTTFAPDVAFNTTLARARLTFPGLVDGLLPDGNYRVTFDGQVFDPSGNVSTDTESIEFFVLAGDANRDRVVNLGDFLALREAFGTGLFFSQGDFNGDGSVDLNDFLILRANFNASVPAPTQFLFGSDGDGEDRGSLFA